MLCNLRVVHTNSAKHTVIGSPAIGSTVRIHLVVLQVEKSIITLLAEGDLGSTDITDANHATTNHVEEIGDDGTAQLLAYLFVQTLPHALVELDKGLWTTALTTVSLQLLTLFTNTAIVELDHGKGFVVLSKVAQNQDTDRMYPAFATILDDKLFRRLGTIGSLTIMYWIGQIYNNSQLSGALAVKSYTHTQHGSIHQEFKRLGEILINILCGNECTIVQSSSQILRVDLFVKQILETKSLQCLYPYNRDHGREEGTSCGK